MSQVAAVIVTFNRKEMLLETLSGVLSQTSPVEKIFLVNNASSDGTEALLKEQGYLDNPTIEYVQLEKNTGGAGGFHEGIKRAYEAGYNWFWTMDDDVEPLPETLYTLLKYTDISECINSTKIFTENNEVQYWEQYFDFATSRLIDLKNVSFRNNKEWCSVNVSCFEGMLVSRNIIDKIGLPNKDYFIFHDDTLFGILASFYTNVIYVKDAVFHKKIYGYGAATPFRAYYSIRNTMWLVKDVFSTGYVGKLSLWMKFLLTMNLIRISLLMLVENFSFSMIKSILKGWKDGAHKNHHQTV